MHQESMPSVDIGMRQGRRKGTDDEHSKSTNRDEPKIAEEDLTHTVFQMTKKEKTVLIHLLLSNIASRDKWSLEERIQYGYNYLHKMYTIETVPPYYTNKYGDNALDLDIWAAMSIHKGETLRNNCAKQWKREMNNIKSIIKP